MPASERFRLFSEPADRLLAAYRARLEAPRPLAYRTRAAWLTRRPEARRLAREALGIDPAPERLPLAVRETEAPSTGGRTLRRLHWQVWPGVYAGGWLCQPASLPERAPALLHVAAPGPDSQAPVSGFQFPISAAAIELLPDPFVLEDDAVGLNPLGALAWAHLRALDLLLARPEVDGERLGLLGETGGGLLAACLLALDDRPRAAVLSGLGAAGAAAPGLLRDPGALELAACFAPRPLLFALPEEGAEAFAAHELAELRGLYRLFGPEERLALHAGGGTAAGEWFARWLGAGEAGEPPPEPLPPEALLHPPTANLDEARAWYRERAALQPPRLESRATRKRWQESLRETLRPLAGEPGEEVALAPRRHGEETRGGIRSEKLSFASEADVRLPALLLVPDGAARAPAALLLHPEGKAGWFRNSDLEPLPRALLAAGWALLLPDTRLRGELAADWQPADVRAWGRPEVGMAARDALAGLDLLHRREEIDWRRLLVWGAGDLGVAALLAAGWDERPAAVVADCVDTTYRDGGEGLPPFPNVLRAADLPQIAALAAPRPLWLYRVHPGRVGFASLRYYDFTRRTYQSFGAAESLRMGEGPPDVPALQEWLARPWRRLPKS